MFPSCAVLVGTMLSTGWWIKLIWLHSHGCYNLEEEIDIKQIKKNKYLITNWDKYYEGEKHSTLIEYMNMKAGLDWGAKQDLL